MNKFAFRAYDYRIYYVNIDLRHHYGISVAEAQTFLLAKRPQRRGARRNGCFRRRQARYQPSFLGKEAKASQLDQNSFVNKVWPKRAFFLRLTDAGIPGFTSSSLLADSII